MIRYTAMMEPLACISLLNSYVCACFCGSNRSCCWGKKRALQYVSPKTGLTVFSVQQLLCIPSSLVMNRVLSSEAFDIFLLGIETRYTPKGALSKIVTHKLLYTASKLVGSSSSWKGLIDMHAGCPFYYYCYRAIHSFISIPYWKALNVGGTSFYSRLELSTTVRILAFLSSPNQ